MSNKPSDETFVQFVLSGQRLAEEIDEFIADWHESEDRRSLAQSLGFTDDEYALWVEQPATLELIIATHHAGTTLDQMQDWTEEVHLVAARSNSQADATKLISWLRRTGRVK